MAPPTGRTPKAKKPGDFSAVGKKGRATGIEVPSLGPRDMNDMEPLQGLFSSPEKSPQKRNGVQHDSTIVEDETDEESMDIGSSTIPEPTEVIRSRSGKAILPPPRSRSPMKTSLGTPARRSLGPLSSPPRQSQNETPTHIRSRSHPPNRLLEFSMSETYSSTKGSGAKGKSAAVKAGKSKPMPAAGKRKRGMFDLGTEQEGLSTDNTNLFNGNGMTNGILDDDNVFVDNHDNSILIPNGDDEPAALGETEIPDEENNISPSIERDPAPEAKNGRGKRTKNLASHLVQEQAETSTLSPRPRGRPPKKTKDIVENDVRAESTRRSDRNTETTMLPPKGKGARLRPILTDGDPNTKLNPPKRSRTAKPAAANRGMSPTKSRFVARSETPGDELNFRTTRAGRNVVKPLAYWRGEAAVWGASKVEGGNLILPSIKEVIRTEEVPEPIRRKTTRRARPRRPPQEDDLPDDDEQEYWETEAGVMRASVMLWDPITGRGDEEAVEEADVAYAAEAIEMRDISGAEFRFAKTLTLPFFGSGMVDLPPGGAKRVKNSRKMQMVFFVFYGRVTVDLGTPTQTFSIGRGGMWQVPRGNFYAITNHSADKPARIFFAQGCEVAPEPDIYGFDEGGGAPGS